MSPLLERLMYGELKALLCRWGDWVERHQEDAGFPPASAFTFIPGMQPGHRILCAEMPRKVYFVNQAILMLEKTEQSYLRAWYVWTHDPEGHWLDQSQKAEQLGLKYGCFAARVRDSRRKLLRLKKIWAI